MDSNSFNKKIQNRFILFTAILFSILFAWMIRGYLMPLLMASLTAGLFYSVYKWIKKRIKNKTISSTLTVLFILLVFVIPISIFIGIVVDQANEISKDIVPFIKNEIQKGQSDSYQLPSWVPFQDFIISNKVELTKKISELSGKVGSILVGSLTSLTQGTFTFFLGLFIFLYALFFFLMDGKTYLQKLRKFVPMNNEDFDEMLDKGLSITRATLKGAILIGVLQGGLIGIMFAILGIKGAAFWGAVSIVLSLIPSIGSGLVWVPAVIILYTQGEVRSAIILLVWGGAIVGSIDNILRPKLVGKDTKMSDLMILLSTLGGLSLFGIAGFILGPILAGMMLTIWKIYGKVFIFNDEVNEL